MSYAAQQAPAGGRRRVAIGVAVLLVATAAGFGISTLAGSSQRDSALLPRGGITRLGNANPFGPSGKLVTLRQFVADKAAEGYDVPLPASRLANSNNVGNIWESTTGEVVAFFPSSGIELNYGGVGVDYTGIPVKNIQRISGVRAVVWGAGNPERNGFAEVLLPLPSGHLVELLSQGPVADLVSVAKSMPIHGSR